jgi:hypothetical protein
MPGVVASAGMIIINDIMEEQFDPVAEESKKIRLLRTATDLLIQAILSGGLSIDEAVTLIKGVRQFAMKLFPGKEKTFDLIYMPKFRRAMREAGLGDGTGRLRVLDGGQK